MAYHEKLAQIVTEPFDLSYNVSITKKEINPKVSSDWEKHGFSCDNDAKIIYLNPDYIPASKRAVYNEILKDYLEENHKLLEIKTSTILHELYDFERRHDHKPVLSFFEPIIPYDDYEALAASFFLRDMFQRHEDISDYKRDIRLRHGDRGNNISNLCTAGYFEHFLPDLYNSSENKKEFLNIYNEIVNSSMMALFVSPHTKLSEIPNLIKQKISSSRKYGLKFVHIHAISNKNIKKVRACLDTQKEFFKVYEKNIYESKNKDILILELVI